LKNAEVYRKVNATVIVDEDRLVENPNIIVDAVNNILSDPIGSKKMAHIFSSFARPNAAQDVADVIISNAK
jgi:UDP-N-acetylglucosamine:LPS N-acetylglucosamine transferase